jgi:hypothetical protein
MFYWAVDVQLIGKNPVPRRSSPKVEKIEKPALTEQQVQGLLGAVPVQYRAFYAVLALTGVRCGEALGLKWADIDFADSTLHVRHAIYRGKETTPKTPAALRDRPTVPELRQALLNHKVMAVYREPSDYVFASASGSPLNPDLLRETLQAILKCMGCGLSNPVRMDCTFCAIRAVCCSIGARVAISRLHRNGSVTAIRVSLLTRTCIRRKISSAGQPKFSAGRCSHGQMCLLERT